LDEDRASIRIFCESLRLRGFARNSSAASSQ
jgi:hypothetical protein